MLYSSLQHCLYGLQCWVCWTLFVLRLTGRCTIWARRSPRDSLETASVDFGAKSGFCEAVRNPGPVVPLAMFELFDEIHFL